METTKKQYNGQFRIFIYLILIITGIIMTTSCTQTQHLCPAYGSSWDRTQSGGYGR
jgi:hypothetical protein